MNFNLRLNTFKTARKYIHFIKETKKKEIHTLISFIYMIRYFSFSLSQRQRFRKARAYINAREIESDEYITIFQYSNVSYLLNNKKKHNFCISKLMSFFFNFWFFCFQFCKLILDLI